QLQLDHAPQSFFILHHQNRGFHRPSSLNGTNTRNTLPDPGSVSTAIVPPCSSTILETIARPRPTPLDFVVKKGLKILSLSLAAIPDPRSITAISTMSPICRVFTVILP